MRFSAFPTNSLVVKTHAKHIYRWSRQGRPVVCLRCGVKRRTAKDRNGRWRRAVDERGGARWQYKSPCSSAWQHAHLPCTEPK
jgi:hypothetical protein